MAGSWKMRLSPLAPLALVISVIKKELVQKNSRKTLQAGGVPSSNDQSPGVYRRRMAKSGCLRAKNGVTANFDERPVRGRLQPGVIERNLTYGGGNALSLSPDERWILYTQADQAGSDLMLVENFQ
jgi:hypothetical protein